MYTILIVDDEQDIREILSFNLTEAGYNCRTAANGKAALELLTREKADLILLDVMMPEMSGFEVARTIRNDELSGVPYDLPIIFLTALGEEEDMLHGFALGADDYVAKPFSLRLLMARVEAIRKRTHLPADRSVLQKPTAPTIGYDMLILDEMQFTATISGKDIELTKMEYELLNFFLRHQGVVYSRSELLEQVWPENGLVLDRTVDVTITRIRKKIGIYKEHLKAKTGYGYYWEK